MATSVYASTPETTNANRTSRVLLGPCSDQLRDVLRHYVPPNTFPHVIRYYRPKLPRLTLPQKDLILPRTGHYSSDYSDMDISLLYLLLRNICNIQPHMNGWGNSPDVNDTSLAANIERIREARNKVGHSNSASLSLTDFTDIWSYIKDAVKSMDAFLKNGNKYEKEMDFLSTETMDPEQELYITQLRKEMEEDKLTREIVRRIEESVNDQQVDIQVLQTGQQESHRQLTQQQGDIQDVQSQQQELHRQLIDQQGDIQDVQSQQQELHRQLTQQQGDIQDVQSQQQELHRQLIDQQKISQTQVIPDEEHDLKRLKERLVKINDLEIPLTPLQKDSDKLPVEQLFASVIIKEDSKETRKGKKSTQDGKEQELKKVKTPEDMLTKNGKPVRCVYMLGDAAHGKTTYCTWLLKKWCNAQTPGMSGRLNEWENALSQFDFVFHLKFRDVDPSKTNVKDMICQVILGDDAGLHTAVKHVLSSDKYRCLIIMDGLDEWKSDQFKYKGMPYIDNMSNCVIFTTMRPWMFADVAELVSDDDRVIEIQGLDDKGIKDVIKKVLVHYYELKQGCAEYKTKYKEIISKLKDKTLKSFLHIPLLAVVCIQIWCEGEQVGDSLTSFYVAMVNILIERAQVKKQIPKLFLDTTNISLPRILSSKKNINSFSNVLLRLGKVAYEGLISKQMKLVFQTDNLESEIGERELKFALDVGLISQTEAHGITTRKVNVHFFHKSVQEFLAVMYIVTQKKVSDNFCTRLCNVKVIMELSNVIMFICGMCPSLGSVISQIVVSVTDSDGGICEYRELPLLDNDTVNELYKLQVSWYRELQYGQTDSLVTDSPMTDSPLTDSPMTYSPVTGSPVTDSPVTDSPVTDSPVTFHVSDVYLDYNSDTETVRVTRELLSGHHDIRSLTLVYVPTDGEYGIPDTELGDFLSDTDKTRSLVRLHIDGKHTGRSVHTLCGPSLRTLCLMHVTIQDRDSVRPVITQTDRLQRLQLYNVSLGDRGLGLTPHMTDLQEVELYRVRMTQSGWGSLIQSVIDIHHQFVVTLLHTDIDSDSVSTLHSSPHISVTRDDVIRYGMYGGRYIEFTRVWPLTQDTQCILL